MQKTTRKTKRITKVLIKNSEEEIALEILKFRFQNGIFKPKDMAKAYKEILKELKEGE